MDILISEILDKVSKAKTKQNKVALLKQYNSPALRMVIKSSFDPKIKWALPEGEVPFKRNDAPAGTEHSVLSYESRKLYHYIEGGNNLLSQRKRETMFVQMLEGLHKGLSANVVKEAFNWTDEFMVDDHATYHQMPGPANG